MKKKSLEQLARQSGVSKSTVSRVLNNCPGVDGELREAVIAAAREDYAAAAGGESPADVCVILPDNPKFFWGQARDALRDTAHGLDVRVYVYSSLSKNEVLCDYFERIERSNVKAIVFAGYAEGEARLRLERLASTRLLICLCEYDHILNSFFVGANAYDDGAQLGRSLLRLLDTSGKRTVAIVGKQSSYNCRLRELGFTDTVRDRVGMLRIEPPAEMRLWSSYLARALSEVADRIDFVFCSDGMTVPCCEGIRKLKLKRPIPYFGFEDPPTAAPYWDCGAVGALMVQMPGAQISYALSLCRIYLKEHTYPSQKMLYVPSKLRENE